MISLGEWASPVYENWVRGLMGPRLLWVLKTVLIFFKGTEAEYCTISPLSDLYFNRPRALIEDREVPAFTYHGLRHEGLDFLGECSLQSKWGWTGSANVCVCLCVSLCSLNGSLWIRSYMEALSVEDAFSSLLLLCTVLELVLSSHPENAKEGGSNPRLWGKFMEIPRKACL